GDAGHFALRSEPRTGVLSGDIAQAFNPSQIILHLVARPPLAFRAALQFRRAKKQRRREPIRAIKPAVLEEQQISEVPLARVLSEDFSSQGLMESTVTQAGILCVFAISNAIHSQEQLVQRHFAITQPLEVKWLQPRLVGAGR